jgi:hypothetical protein
MCPRLLNSLKISVKIKMLRELLVITEGVHNGELIKEETLPAFCRKDSRKPQKNCVTGIQGVSNKRQEL